MLQRSNEMTTATSMHRYAQTYPQFLNQLRGLDYSNVDLELIRDAYELAMPLFTGRFQPSGKVFIAHVVGTASILASLRLPAPAVAAGLLHNAYLAGDFGDGGPGLTSTRRQRIKHLLGAEVEAYVARFPSLGWRSSKVKLALENPIVLEAIDRTVLLILMADHLEHLFDLDLVYYEEQARRRYLENCKIAARMATSLGLASLAAEFDEWLRATTSSEAPVAFPVQRITARAFVVVPKSQRKRLVMRVRARLYYEQRRFRREVPKQLSRVRNRLRSVVWSRFSTRSPEFLYVAVSSRALQRLVCKNIRIDRVATGFQFTEGPVWVREEESLLFSDIPANKIFKLTSQGKITVFRHPSGNANGLTRDARGRIIACEDGNRRVTRAEMDGRTIVLADQFQGKKLNSPNDVVVKSDGAIYFTDPAYRITPDQREQPVEGVYRLSPDGQQLSLVCADFTRPNGLAFSPDEQTLYVDDSHQRHIRAFTVQNDGSLSGGAIFHDMNASEPGVPDGMKVDAEGHIYCTGAGGIWVFDCKGEHLGTIRMPEKPSNCAWGDKDWRTLYITAVTSIYTIRVKVTGLKVS